MSKANWGYIDPAEIRKDMMTGMSGYVTGFDNLADTYGGQADSAFGLADKYSGMASGLLSGDSPILDAMRRQQSQALGDIGAQKDMQQGRALAARGMGGGGLRQALSANTASQLGEQASQGLLGIQKYGLEAGKGIGQLGQQMYSTGSDLLAGQGQAIGSGAQMTSQANQAMVSQMQANAANRAQYLQAEAARQRAEDRRKRSGIGGLIGGIAGAALGTAFGAPMIGMQLGSSFGQGIS